MAKILNQQCISFSTAPTFPLWDKLFQKFRNIDDSILSQSETQLTQTLLYGNQNYHPSINLKQKLYDSFFMDGVELPQGYSNFEEAVYLLPLSPQKFLVLILRTSEGWKTESTLEPSSGF